MTEWINRKQVLEMIELPALMWMQGYMHPVSRGRGPFDERSFFINVYDADEYADSRVIDSRGRLLEFSEFRRDKLFIDGLWGVLQLLFQPFDPIMSMQGELLSDTRVEFEVFQKEICDFVETQKWYEVPGQGMTQKDQFRKVEMARNARNFAELFKPLGHMMSAEFREAW